MTKVKSWKIVWIFDLCSAFVQLRLQPKLSLFLQAMPAFKINCRVKKTGKSL